MANYFTQYHFSPRWTSPAHHDAPAEHLTPKSTNSHHANNHPHRLPGHMHDTVSRFIQALNFHYGPDDYDVVHPHFDMVETKTCYAVYGGLPGLGREDVAVEANDHLFTLTIAGELKRPAPQEANPKRNTVATTADTEGVGISHLNRPAPASEEPDASNASKATPPPAAAQETEATSSTAKPSTEQQDEKDDVYWHIKERKIGHFKRVFRFPVELVEMGNIKASIHHGLLCVIVPKRDDTEAYNKKVEEARKVDIFQGGPDSTYPLFGYFF
ncbi:HSP20-like chaperone [Rhypophila sp. PSN 637]